MHHYCYTQRGGIFATFAATLQVIGNAMHQLDSAHKIIFIIQQMQHAIGITCHVIEEVQLDTQDIRIKGSYMHESTDSIMQLKFKFESLNIKILIKDLMHFKIVSTDSVKDNFEKTSSCQPSRYKIHAFDGVHWINLSTILQVMLLSWSGSADYRMHWFPGESTIMPNVRLFGFGSMILHMGVHHIEEKYVLFGLIISFEWSLTTITSIINIKIMLFFGGYYICFVSTGFINDLPSDFTRFGLYWFFGSSEVHWKTKERGVIERNDCEVMFYPSTYLYY